MRREFATIARHGVVYATGIVLSKIVSFLMLPLYTNYLMPSEYGVLQLLSLFFDAVSTVMSLGMAAAVVRYYHEAKTDAEKNSVFSSATLGAISVMSLVAIACVSASPLLSKLIFSSGEYTSYFQIMACSTFLYAGIEIPMILRRVRLESGSFVLINLVRLVLQLSLNIYFLAGLRLGVLGILYSTLITNAIISSYLAITTFRSVGFHFEWDIYKTMLRFGAPLIVADSSMFLLTYADRFVLNHFCDLTIVGLYSMAYTIGMTLSVFINAPFSSIWSTEMYRYSKGDSEKSVFSRLLTYYLLVALTVGLCISLLSRDVLRIMAAPSYWSAYKIVPFIAFSYVINGIISITGAGLLIKGKTKYKAVSTGTSMIANLALNFLLIPTMQAAGAALATLIAFALRLVIDTYYSQKWFPLKYEYGRLVYLLLASGAMMTVAAFLEIENVVLSLAVSLLLCLVLPASFFLFRISTRGEQEFVLSCIRNPVKSLREIF